MAFPTKSKAHHDLIAALHPYDLSARPQIVRKDWNPEYFKVLKTFEKITGVGGILNTSFNLHGEPIVCSPKDALDTFVPLEKNSDDNRRLFPNKAVGGLIPASGALRLQDGVL